MNWLKYRAKYSYGDTPWTWTPLYTENGFSQKVVIKDLLTKVWSAVEYSDKFEGVEHKTVPHKKVPTYIVLQELESLTKQSTSIIDHVKQIQEAHNVVSRRRK
jgi:hypothetical protein